MVVLEGCRRVLGPGVTFACDKFRAAEGIQLALWGPSGCGKSTMLNLITGLLRADQGSITVDGVDTTKLSQGRLDRFRGERFGFVFQTFNLLAPFSALQNVMIGMRFSDIMPEKEWKPRAVELLRRVGLENRMHSKPAALSVGERQRVAIARALASKPKIIAADEPTGSLDPKTAKKIMDLLLALCREEQVTLLMVTHAPELADLCSERFDCTGLIQEVDE